MSEQAPALEQRRSIDPLQAFQQAIPFQHQGRLWEVEQFYEIVLKALAPEPGQMAKLTPLVP